MAVLPEVNGVITIDLPDPCTYQIEVTPPRPYLPNPIDDLSTYPMLEAEIGVTAPTAWELAQLWANVSVQWRAIAARIEGTGMRSIARIENCADPDDLNAILATFRPLQERL